MINRLFQKKQILFKCNNLLQYKFSSNPYYILGVEKNQSFNEIKKVYYKLAAQYHPDINQSPNASKQFMLIKDAFEKIKQQKGEGVQQNLENSFQQRQDFNSVRKDSQDYEETWDDETINKNNQNEQTDYKEFVYKVADEEQNQDTLKFGKSFDALHKLKEGQFKPIDMVMPDPSKRFDLDKVMKLKVFSDGSNFYIGFLLLIGCAFFFTLNISVRKISQRQYENYIYSLLNYKDIKEDLDDGDFIERINYDLQKSVEYKQYVKEQKNKSGSSEELIRRNIPIIQDFISSNTIKTHNQIPL